MSELRKIAIRNILRHPLRSGLTVLGIAVALFAFSLIRTFIGAWYAGVEASAKDRLIVRNAVSLVFYLPISYGNTIREIPGITKVGFANWFGGIYKDERYRFQQFAVSDGYMELYPEYEVPPQQLLDWNKERKGILVGQDLAKSFGLSVGDVFQLKGTIFPGMWEFKVSGIFSAKDGEKDTRLMYFHWDYLNERNKTEFNRQPDHAGFYAVQLASGVEAAKVSEAIDSRFKNSYAETLTETETAFVQGFVSMSSTIIQALNVISIVVLAIMLLVLANTMLMSFRERFREFSVLKSIGFQSKELSQLLIGEAALLAAGGFALLLVFLLPLFLIPSRKLLGDLINFFPVFKVTLNTVLLSALIAGVVALIAGLIPLYSLIRLKVSEGIRKAI